MPHCSLRNDLLRRNHALLILVPLLRRCGTSFCDLIMPITEVVAILESLQLEQYVATFVENDILTKADLLLVAQSSALRELIPKLGPRVRLQAWGAQERTRSRSTAASGSDAKPSNSTMAGHLGGYLDLLNSIDGVCLKRASQLGLRRLENTRNPW